MGERDAGRFMVPMRVRSNVILLGLVLCCSALLQGGDWPSYRGPTQNGVCAERINKVWPAQGPRLLWKVPLTGGFSSFTVAGGRAFTQVRRTVGGADSEVCVALDVGSGAELWATIMGPAEYDDGGNTGAPGNTGGDGPRSTPVVSEGRVYVLSSLLKLVCLQADNGQKVWSHDLPAEYGASVISWQNAAAPVVDGDLVILNGNIAGQRLHAFRKTSGSVAWKGLDERMTQSTPVLATIHGVRQLVFATQAGLLAVDPQTGGQLWRSSLSYSVSTGISPVVVDDVVYLSAAYNVGAMAVQVTKSGAAFSAARIWRKSGQLMNHWSTPVHHDGHLYGLYGYSEYGTAPLKCVELATGTEKWSVDGFGHGGVLVADGSLLVLSDAGDLVLVDPDPEVYRELHRFRAVVGKCWNSPAISNGRLFVRSTREGACYDVALPALRWQPPQRDGAVGLRLDLGTADGSSLDATRAAKVQVRLGDDVSLPAVAWEVLALPGVLTNGLLRFNLPWDTQVHGRLFIAEETP